MNKISEIASALPLGDGVRVVRVHEAGLVALDKPAGLSAHPNAGDSGEAALLRAAYDAEGEFYFWKNGELPARVFLLNRIDSPTSGLILLATNEAVADAVRKLFREKEVSKTYFAAVKGARGAPDSGVWRDFLSTTRERGTVRSTVSGKCGAPAVSAFKRITGDTENLGASLLKLMPKTGRTHQLRVQCASHHVPIAGDQTYGDFAFNKRVRQTLGTKRMFLHSAAIEFAFSLNGAEVKFSAKAELPAEFLRLFGKISPEPDAEKKLEAGTVKVSGNLSVRVNLRRR